VINEDGSMWGDGPDRPITNLGRWGNFGIVFGFGYQLVNHGVFNNHGGLTTCDDFQIYGTVDNRGLLNNFGGFSVCGSTVENVGTVQNSGSINDGATAQDLPGTVENSGLIVDCGSLTAAVLGNPATPAPDGDGDGHCDPMDCAAADGSLWALPDEARLLRLSHGIELPGLTRLDWAAPQFPGATSLLYDVVSSGDPSDFLLGPLATCVESDDGTDLTASEGIDPGPGEVSSYLVYATNGCGTGSVGTVTGGALRLVRDCP